MRASCACSEGSGRGFASAFSATTLVLAGIGLFGMVAYSVSQRRRELGIRTALGARPRDLVAAAMRSAAVVTCSS